MMKQATIQISSIGHIANQVLLRNHSFQVVGITSQGIYLQPESDLTLFLSSDLFRGPLTLNSGETGNLPSPHPGVMAQKTGDLLIIDNSSLVFNIRSPLVWTPPKPPDPKRQPKNHFAEVLRQAGSIVPDHPNFSLLQFATNGSPALLKEEPPLVSRIVSLYRSLGTGNKSEIISGMKLVLGAGPGLTPLGDDLLIGILLVIKHSGKHKFRSEDEAAIYQALLNAAQEKTTKLSWSLLHCAAQGSADERIIRVLDGLLTGRAIPDQDLQNLLTWGSSSGMAVLAGMLLVLTI